MTSDYLSSPANQNKSPESEKPNRRKNRDWSGATIGLAIGLAGLFGARLGQIWIGFDIFAQFWIQFAFLTLACTLGLASPRYKTLVAIVVLTVILAGYSAWPYYVSSNPSLKFGALDPGEKALKVASFNTYLHNKDFAAIANEVLRLDADVVTLVEFGPENQKVLDELHAQYPYQETCWNVDGCDFAIVSKTPLSDAKGLDNWTGPPFMSAKLGPEFGSLTIVGVHTNRFPHQRSQLTQVLAFVKYLETVPGRIVMMGDFNATPFSRITQTLADGLGLTRLTYLPTWSATYGLPQLAIDHIFVSPKIRALDHERIGEYAGSDHFPITMTLAIPTSP